MLQNLKSILIALLVLHVAHVGYSQVDTIYIPIKYDSYIDESTPSTNYGSDTLMKIGHFTDTSTHYQRVYVYFETDSIPPNAYVSGMQMQLPFFNQLNTQDTMVTSRVIEQWYEDSITYNNQPDISSITDGSWTWNHNGSQLVLASSPAAMRKIMDGFYENHGFVIQMQNETDTNQAYINLGTSEHSDTTKRPKVMIIYYYPIEIQNIQVQHESHSGADDGSISFETLYGTQDFTYEWIDGSTGNVISTDSVLDSLSYGWYGVKISGNLNDVYYHAFLVGVECDTVSISVQLDKFYTDYAFIANTTAGDGTENEFVNFGNPWGMMAMNWNGGANGWNQQRTLIDPLLYMDPAFNIQQADYTMYGSNHYYNNWKTNKCELELITEDWHELKVTFNNQPAFSDTIKVLVDSTHYATQNRTADVTDFWNYWKEDYSNKHGMMFKIESETNTFIVRQMYHPVSSTTASLRPLLEFTLDLVHQSYTDMAWDTETETGSITVDIGKYCGTKTAPYKYMLSYDSIPDLDTLYSFIRDTVYSGSLDSTLFFSGIDTTFYKFDNLTSGRYYLSVFDSTWTRLVDEEIIVRGEMVFEAQTGLTIRDNEITGTQSNSSGSLSIYTQNDQDGELEVRINATSGEQFFGFSELDSTVLAYDDISYGIYLKDDTLYTIDRGILSTSYYIVDTSDALRVGFEDDSVFYRINYTVIDAKLSVSEYTYKAGMGMQSGETMKVVAKKFKFKIPKYKFKYTTDNFTCNDNYGEFSFKVDPLFSSSAYSVTFTVVNENNVTIVASGSGTSGSYILVDEDDYTQPLNPGIYTVDGYILSTPQGNIHFVQTIALGYETIWSTVGGADYANVPNSYSVLDEGNDELNYTESHSTNVLLDTEDGWSEFRPIAISGVNYFRFTAQNLGSNVSQSEPHIFFINGNNGSMMYINDPALSLIPVFAIGTNSRVRLMYDLAPYEVRIYANNILKTFIDRNSSTILARCRSLIEGDGFRNVINSFCAPQQPLSTLSHAELKREIDGGFTNTVDGILKFTFDEEYNQEGSNYIPFKIYDKTQALLVSSDIDGNVYGSISPLTYDFDDNKRELDLSGASGFVVGECYTMIVTTATGEKRYLQFYFKN